MLHQKAKTPEPTQEMLHLSTQNSSNSPLLNLPSDIRKCIYEYVFTTGETIHLLPLDARLERAPSTTAAKENKTKSIESIICPNINTVFHLSPLPKNKNTEKQSSFACLLTSRQIYQETFLLPFHHNTIHSTNLWDLATILRRLPPTQVSSIRALKIRWVSAQSAVREYRQAVDAARMLPGPVRLVLRMLDGLERVVVDEAGFRRLFPDRKRVEEALEALEALVGRKLKVEFEGKYGVGKARRVGKVK